jgi:hypothetical protein
MPPRWRPRSRRARPGHRVAAMLDELVAFYRVVDRLIAEHPARAMNHAAGGAAGRDRARAGHAARVVCDAARDQRPTAPWARRRAGARDGQPRPRRDFKRSSRPRSSRSSTTRSRPGCGGTPMRLPTRARRGRGTPVRRAPHRALHRVSSAVTFHVERSDRRCHGGCPRPFRASPRQPWVPCEHDRGGGASRRSEVRRAPDALASPSGVEACHPKAPCSWAFPGAFHVEHPL